MSEKEKASADSANDEDDLNNVAGGSLTQDANNIWHAENTPEKVGTVGGLAGLAGALGYGTYRSFKGETIENEIPYEEFPQPTLSQDDRSAAQDKAASQPLDPSGEDPVVDD